MRRVVLAAALAVAWAVLVPGLHALPHSRQGARALHHHQHARGKLPPGMHHHQHFTQPRAPHRHQPPKEGGWGGERAPLSVDQARSPNKATGHGYAGLNPVTERHNFRCAVCKMFATELKKEWTHLHHPSGTPKGLDTTVGRVSWVTSETQMVTDTGDVDISSAHPQSRSRLFIVGAYGNPIHQMMQASLVLPSRVCGRLGDVKLISRCHTYLQTVLVPEILRGERSAPGPTFSPLDNDLCDQRCDSAKADEESADGDDEEDVREGWEEMENNGLGPTRQVKFGIGAGELMKG